MRQMIEIDKALSQSILGKLEEIESSLAALCAHLKREARGFHIAVNAPASLKTPIEEVVSIIASLEYEDTQNLSRVRVLQGAVGCDAATLKLVEASNQAKTDFLTCIKLAQAS